MQRTNIYLDEGQLRVLDRMAAEEGTSRAELIRRLLDGCLAGGDRDLGADLEAIEASFGADLEAIEASFGALGGFDLPERGSDDRGRHLDRMWSLRG